MEQEYLQRRKLQAQETQRKILSSALFLMRERGFDKVSIRDICKAAGITTGAFYHHFPSKEALLEQGFAPLDDYMRRAMEGHDGEAPADRLWRILASYAQFMEDSRELIGRYYQRRLAEPHFHSMDPDRYTLRVMLDCFRQAEREGILRIDRNPEWVADFCYRHFRGLVIDWILRDYGYPLLPKMEEDYQLFAAMFQG